MGNCFLKLTYGHFLLYHKCLCTDSSFTWSLVQLLSDIVSVLWYSHCDLSFVVTMICGSADTISDLFSSSCYKDALDDLPVLKPEHKKWVEHQGLPPLVNAREWMSPILCAVNSIKKENWWVNDNICSGCWVWYIFVCQSGEDKKEKWFYWIFPLHPIFYL